MQCSVAIGLYAMQCGSTSNQCLSVHNQTNFGSKTMMQDVRILTCDLPLVEELEANLLAKEDKLCQPACDVQQAWREWRSLCVSGS